MNSFFIAVVIMYCCLCRVSLGCATNTKESVPRRLRCWKGAVGPHPSRRGHVYVHCPFPSHKDEAPAPCILLWFVLRLPTRPKMGKFKRRYKTPSYTQRESSFSRTYAQHGQHICTRTHAASFLREREDRDGPDDTARGLLPPNFSGELRFSRHHAIYSQQKERPTLHSTYQPFGGADACVFLC